MFLLRKLIYIIFAIIPRYEKADWTLLRTGSWNVRIITT